MASGWTTWLGNAAWPALSHGDVHVWRVKLHANDSELQACRAVLSPDELERAERFRIPEHRIRSEVTRAVLRILLARYIGSGARDMQFVYNLHGKPELSPGHADPAVHFNVSHSHDLAVFAVTRLGTVGVDIERIRHDMPRRDEIAVRYFAPGEVAQLNALPEAERVDGFFRCWTRKEAFVKARGDGIFAGLQTFEVCLALSEARLLRSDDDATAAANWWLAALPRVEGYAGAVAVHAPRARLLCWEMEIGALVR